MIELTYLPPENTAGDEKFILLQNVMKRLAQLFPNFIIGKNTDKDLGRKLAEMGYEHKHMNNGSSFKMKEI